MYIDRIYIFVKGGDGGDGYCSFRKEKYIKLGKPDGGDGGIGGNVYIIGDYNLNNLSHIKSNGHYKAYNGNNGSSINCTGRSGQKLIIPVPVGTRIFNKITGKLVFEILNTDKKYLIAKGGINGLGNYRFKNSIYQAPTKITKGTCGEIKRLYISFISISDIALLGFPNSGKSTLLNKISCAKSQVAEFYFTTQQPYLGISKMLKNQKYIFIDLPGFTKNIVMHQNVNSNFIHHALRVKIIFYIIDIYNNDLINICKNFKKLLLIIQKTNVKLFLKDSWIIINKIDMVNLSYATIMCDKIVRDLKWKNPVFEISAINIIGINEVFDAISFYL